MYQLTFSQRLSESISEDFFSKRISLSLYKLVNNIFSSYHDFHFYPCGVQLNKSTIVF